MNSPITIRTTVHADLKKVWDCWNKPKHITHWAFASDDWEAPSVVNDLRTGGSFNIRMSAKDKSAGFDFAGIYSLVEDGKRIEYNMADGRHVSISFEVTSEGIRITEVFDPEQENPKEMQQKGWQSILDNFKKYVENNPSE